MWSRSIPARSVCARRNDLKPVISFPPFDITVILLNPVIQILALPDGNGFFLRFVGIERGQSRRIGGSKREPAKIWARLSLPSRET